MQGRRQLSNAGCQAIRYTRVALVLASRAVQFAATPSETEQAVVPLFVDYGARVSEPASRATS